MVTAAFGVGLGGSESRYVGVMSEGPWCSRCHQSPTVQGLFLCYLSLCGFCLSYRSVQWHSKWRGNKSTRSSGWALAIRSPQLTTSITSVTSRLLQKRWSIDPSCPSLNSCPTISRKPEAKWQDQVAEKGVGSLLLPLTVVPLLYRPHPRTDLPNRDSGHEVIGSQPGIRAIRLEQLDHRQMP